MTTDIALVGKLFMMARTDLPDVTIDDVRAVYVYRDSDYTVVYEGEVKTAAAVKRFIRESDGSVVVYLE